MPIFDQTKGTKIMVDGLGEGARKWEIEEVFTEFGKVLQVWVARRQPGLAFVYFSNYRDAVEAIKHLDGTLVSILLITTFY